jgi:hypothetical protein
MKSCFLRVLEVEDKSGALLALAAGRSNIPDGARRFDVDPTEFGAMPGSPFAYWAPKSLVAWFARWPSFRDSGFEAMTGAKTNDDVRFIRLVWEVLSSQIGSSREDTAHGKGWARITRGGKRSHFYRDIDSVVEWSEDGRCLKAYISEYRGSRGWGYQWSANLNGYDWYFREGITWPLRGIRLSTWPVPRGCLPSGAGKMAYAPLDDLPAVLGVVNSSAFDAALRVFAGKVGGVQYEAGLIQQIPFPSLSESNRSMLANLATRGWSVRRSLDTAVEVSHAFVVPAVLQVVGQTFADRVSAWAELVGGVEAELGRVQSEIDELCFDLYGISQEDRQVITEGFGVGDEREDGPGGEESAQDDEPDESAVGLDPVGLAAGLVSWAVHVAVGRFDVRLVTGERERPAEPDPFDPLPACSPATLTGVDGLPLQAPPAGYPMLVSPVLVDDPGHELHLVAQVRAVFDVVFGDDADRWWTEVGAVLDPRSADLEAWLRKAFFDFHLKTYSKSRRKAPIMWPVGTRSGSYRVWLYAHQVTTDSVFRMLNDIVDPKIHVEERRLTDLRQEAGPSPSASQRKAIDAQETFVGELHEFRDELAAVAPLWAPDLNDGVVIVLAPLWRLFAHNRAWSSELKDRWRKLAAGDYDWAHLAMRLWPERVIRKCAGDRSLAIAHGLEDVFWVADKGNQDKWRPRTIPTTPVEELIAARTNPTITTARQHPTP